MVSYGFYPEAAEEYLAATQYYLEHASELIVEAVIQRLRTTPTEWAIVEEPQIRRVLLTRFPYSIYYRYESNADRVSIYAVMHTSRRPGCWRHRLD